MTPPPPPSIGQEVSSWVAASRPRPDAPLRLLCFPYAGAGTSAFRGWSDLLPRVDVAPVQLPGREARIHERPDVDVETVARAVLPLTDRPYAVFGHSFGARLGFELCRELRRLGAPGPRWLFVSGAHPPHLPRLAPPVSDLPDDQFVDKVRKLGATPPEILDHPEMRDIALPVLRADFAFVDRYRFRPGAPLGCPVTVYAGDGDSETRVDDLFSWADLTTGAFALRVLPGDHFFLHSARSRLLASLAEDLATGAAPCGRVTVPALEEGEVHVWHAPTDELALRDDDLRAALSADERARADAFHFPRDACRFVRRRWMLRRLLAAYGADPGTAPLPTDELGRPGPPPPSKLFFSASSRGGLAAVALSRDRQLGVDVERLGEVGDLELMARSTLTGEERARLETEPAPRRPAAYLRLWTVKESFVKGLGTGLSVDPREVETEPAGPGRWRARRREAAAPGDQGRPWTVTAVEVGPNHIASLAVPEGDPPRVRVVALTKGRLS